MNAILICPGERPDVCLLADEAPLAATPALGHGVLEYWMSYLAGTGVKEIGVLANERTDEIRKVIGNGSRWGVAAEVFPESRELTADQAAKKYGAASTLVDHFPGLPECPLFASYEGWFKALETWMPRANTPDRVGARESRPGIWVGLRAHISRSARLCAPCWIGDHVYVGPGAVIGPGTVLENGAFIEREAEIRNSVVGTATFVGRYVQIANSLAWGNTLVNWQTGLGQIVEDAFLLCSVRLRLPSAKTIPLFDRVAGWLAPSKQQHVVSYRRESGNYEALLVKKES